MAPGRSTVLLGLCATALLCATPSLAASRVTASDVVVVVQPGDTLVGLAARYGTSVVVIATVNGIANPDLIRAGQRIRVTVGRSGNARDKGNQHHVVRPGETLTSIAADFGTTIEAIAAANRLTDPSYVWAGRRLIIPSAIRSKTILSGRHGSQPPTVRRVVAPGETLTAIARRFSTTVAAIASLNNLADPSYIQAGQVLRIPSAHTGTTAGTLPSSVAAGMAERDRVRRIVVAEARRAGVLPALALAVAWQESGWRQKVVSSAGARGVMQLLPTTAVWIGDTMLGHRVDLRSTRGNVRAGLVLLRHYLDRYHGNAGRALAAYYQGQRSADIYGVLPVSRPYIASILTLQRMLH